MNNRKMRYGLVVFYAATLFIAGCFPEEAVLWSDDGSIGVINIGEVLALVDGNTGKLRVIEMAKEIEGQKNPFVSITVSPDGKLIAYCTGSKCSSLSDALKQLPQTQVKLIAHYARQMREQIIRQGGLVKSEFPDVTEGPFAPDGYRNWVIRYMCDNADQELIDKLTPEALDKGKSSVIMLFQLFVASIDDTGIKQQQLVTTSLFAIFRPRISPDKRFVAYLLYNEPSEETALRFDLYLASIKGDVKVMRLADYVALGYSWRDDSKAITYIENSIKEIDQEYSVGTLTSIEVADPNGKLLAKTVPAESTEEGSLATHLHTGKVTHWAGALFHPNMRVQHTSGRIFFSSIAMNLPASTIDDRFYWSVFCCDLVTRSVTNILPRQVSSHLVEDNATGYFAISPDGKKILLPLRMHRFMIYTLGESSVLSPIEESEEFGDSIGDNWQMMPAWKGNDEISCLVSENSHFLTKEGQEKHNRKEIVILGADGKLRRVLSENWPDEIKSGSEYKLEGIPPIPPS